MAEDRPQTRTTNLFQNTVEPKRYVIRLESSTENKKAEFDNGDDFIVENKRLLVKYASDATVAAGNSPAILPDYRESPTKNADGSPAALSDPSTNGQRTFLSEHGTEDGSIQFQKTSKSGMLDAGGSEFKVKRGKEFSTEKMPIDIYDDINRKLDKSDFSLRVQEVLKNNGGNNQNSPYWPVSGKTEDEIVVTTISNQKLGEYGGRKWPTSTSDKTQKITIEDLKKAAMVIALNSTGETAVDAVTLVPKNMPFSDVGIEAVAGAVSNGIGLARIGQKIPMSRFDSVQALKTLNPKVSKPTSNPFIDTGSTLSYGNTNNMFVQFGNGSPVASILSAKLMFTAVLGLLKVTALTLPASSPTLRGQSTAAERARSLGTSTGNAGEASRFLDFFGFPGLSFDSKLCLDEGIDVFFGRSPLIPGGLDNRLEAESDYYNVILRNLYRSTSDFLLNPLVKSAKDFTSSVEAVANQFNPFKLKENIKNLPMTKFIGVLLQIGDRSLTLKNSGQVVAVSGIYDIISKIDGITETDRADPLLGNDTVDPAVLVAKNRLDSRSGMSSIGTSTLKSLYLFPSTIEKAADLLQVRNLAGARYSLSTVNDVRTDDPEAVENGRLKAEIVTKMEDYLERDYVPFYFQDLRTNEIMPFHAFFESMDETHNADYSENEFYGRVGTVPIYKNTKRSINLSFRVISVNEQDHEQMWYKLNRLVAMLYPQWSEGRRLDFRNNRFIQPFSQLPAAAPLIRLRVGDLWKSNYSKFNLARLFGVTGDTTGDTSFRLASMTNTIPPQNREEIIRRYQDIAARMARGEYQVGDLVRITDTSDPLRRGYRIVENIATTANNRSLGNNRILPIPIGSDFSIDRTARLIPTNTAGFRVTGVVTGRDGRPSFIKVTRTRGSASMTTGNVSNRLAPGQRTPARGQQNNSPSTTPATGEFVIAISPILSPDETVIKNNLSVDISRQNNTNVFNSENTSQNASTNQTLVDTFFSKESNPIVRAFESTKGRGLAGVIKTMNLGMEPGETRWVTETFGAKAPMSVKITMEFLPIYDIYPGLDSRGFMTAPVWNVGKTMGDISGRSSEPGYEDSKNSFVKGQGRLPSV